MRNKLWLIAVLFILSFDNISFAQKGKKKEPLKHEKEVRDMVAFFQFMLNTLGDAETSARDKDVLIMESYSKIFRDGKVQVEDDLDPRRKVITNKDITAYLKDVDFFFKDVKFELNIEDIKASGTDDKLFYKVSLTRNLKGTSLDGKAVNNTIPRFIEINYNPKDQDLKIVSIYTNEFDEKEALQNWWNALSYEWQAIFRVRYNLNDSVSLDDIKALTAIDTLDLSNNIYIQNIEPLSQLLDLRVLNLSRTNITDLSPIRNLTQLVNLDLSDTRTEDISALRYSVNLETLNLNATQVQDISVFEKLTNLKQLGIRATNVVNFNPLRYLTALQVLNAESTQLSTLESVDSLFTLQDLNVARTIIPDLNPLAELESIQRLNVDSTHVRDLGALNNLKNLRSLYINYTQVSSLEPLIGLPLLEKVYCDHTGINQPLANAFMAAKPKVLVIFDSEDLRGWWNNLPPVWRDVLSRRARINLDPTKEELAKVTNLDSINFNQYVSIRSIEPLRKLQKLKKIVASQSAIDDLSPLRDHHDIEELDISNTHVSDLAPIRHLKKLKVLKANYTQVQNIDTIAHLAALQKLYVDNTVIEDSQVQNFLKRNSKCLVVYKTSKLNAWWNALSDEWKQIFQTQLRLGAQPSKEMLHQLVELQNVHFGDMPVNDLTPLLEFVHLNDLRFSGTRVSDISPLSEITTLKAVHLNDNPIRNLAPLSALKDLEDVNLSNTPVEDLEVLSSLDNLKKLNCAGTQIKKLNPLEDLSQLEFLDCSNTDVRSLGPVDHLPLTTLKCYNTKISKGQVEKFRKRHPDCNVSYYR